MPSCLHCHKPTNLKCSSCSNFYPADRAAWYCSRSCQTLDWEVHHRECKIANLWSHVRHLYKPTSSLPVDVVCEKLGIPECVKVKMLEYLSIVPLRARPGFYVSSTKMKKEITDAQTQLPEIYRDAKDYKAKWAERVPKKLRDKVGTNKEWQIPYDCRPLTRERPWEELIRFYPQDFEVLSFPAYMATYGADGHGISKSSGSNPFEVKKMHFSELSEIYQLG